MDRTLPDPGFAGDDGSTPLVLGQALAVYREDPEGGFLPALAALSTTRVLVPVVALGEESTEVDMAAVLMERADGQRALLAFTGTAAMTAWNPAARPVPTSAATAAASALQERADALLLDVAGPVLFVVDGVALRQLALGRELVRLTDGWGWAVPPVADVRSPS